MIRPNPFFQIIEPPRVCSYLPAETAALEYLGYHGLTPAELEEFISRGWRRFGMQVFRPACRECSQCVPVRIDVNSFRPTKSQRRTFRRNQNVVPVLAEAAVTRAHVNLYNEWHADMSEKKNWGEQNVTGRLYAQSFLAGTYESAHEIRYYDADKLVGVGLIDLMPESLSSIYFFHAPDWRSAGPGTYSLLCEIELAKRLQLKYVYLGYWIAACPSMAYKNRFHPYEFLPARPADLDEPDWLPGAADEPMAPENNSSPL